jgi:hypothetical protein
MLTVGALPGVWADDDETAVIRKSVVTTHKAARGLFKFGAVI